MTGILNNSEVIDINIKVVVSENHRVESSRRHIGTTTEHNANILNFTFPAQINGLLTSDLDCSLIFETSNGESFVYPVSSNVFSIPKELTRSNYFDMQVQFTKEPDLDWKSFPIRYELADALNNSNINPFVEQQKSDLAELISALSDATGADYTGFTWNQVLNEVTTLNGTEHYIQKVENYLYSAYYTTLRYGEAYDYFKNRFDGNSIGACSSVRNGYIYGRNYDWNYDDKVEFVIATPNKDGRYATLGVASGFKDLTKGNIEEGVDLTEEYKLLPFYLLDGINEYGVVANVNVVPTGDKGITTGTNPEADENVCVLMLVRYILDNFSSAFDAVVGLENINIYAPQSETFSQELHLMVADLNNTYLVEFIENELNVTEISDRPYMTNFYLDGAEFFDDGKVDASSLTPYSMGIERFNIIADKYNTANTVSGMTDLMRDLYITNSYKNTTEPFWYSEFNGDYTSLGYGDLTVFSSPSDYSNIVRYCMELYANRERDGRTSQTVHSSIYDIFNKKLHITVQEGNDVRTYGLPVSLTSTFDEQSILNMVQKYLERDIGGIEAPYTSMSWEEIFGTASNGHMGEIWNFRAIVDSIYQNLYSLERVNPTDNNAITNVFLISTMINRIKSSILDCIKSVLDIDGYMTWEEILETLASLPSGVQAQILSVQESLNQDFKTVIDNYIEDLIAVFGLDLTPEYGESWEDDIGIFSDICVDVAEKTSEESEASIIEYLTGELAYALEQVTEVDQSDKTFDEMVSDISETYENFQELISGMEEVLGITGGDSDG